MGLHLALGTVLVDDSGRVLAGMPHRIDARRIDDEALLSMYHGEVPPMPSHPIGTHRYPSDLPTEVNARLYRLSAAADVLAPPRPLERMSIGLPGATDELWQAYETRVPTTRLVIASTEDPHVAAIERRGFALAATRAVKRGDGLVLGAWLDDPS